MTEPIAYPTTADGWTAFVDTRSEERLARVDECVAQLKDGSSRTALDALKLWNDAQIALRGMRGETELLSEVHPDAAVRALAEARVSDAEAKATAIMSDAELAAVFAALDAEVLDAEAARLLEHTRRDFRRGGAELAEADRERLRALAARDTELALAFARNIREGRREIRVPVTSLTGLPQDFLDAHPADDDGFATLSTDATDLMPVRSYASDRDVRLELTRVRADVAWPENDPVLAELLEVRQQRAELLGYASWADYETEDRMAGSADRIASFLDEVDEASRDAAVADYELLLERMRQDIPDAEGVTLADQMYYSELLRAERFAVDAQEVRPYLAFDRILPGLLETTGRLFDVVYEPVDVPAWHEDVRSYDVVRAGERIGRIHLDLHPRDGKYNHAACFPIAPGVHDRVVPEASLVCNFPRGLMEHRQVQTFFHEFGHLVHEILGGDQCWAAFAGVATEWDFVEAPSQMLEEWVWDADVLASFARNDAGEPIPADLVARMRTADAFGRALDVRMQLGHARLSFGLYRDRPADLAAYTDRVYDESTPVRRLDGTHSYAAFGHLTGYGSCYYTYQWSLVIARALLTGFADGLMDPESASRYRREILEPGGTRDAADLIEAFLGHPYTTDAYRAWLSGS